MHTVAAISRKRGAGAAPLYTARVCGRHGACMFFILSIIFVLIELRETLMSGVVLELMNKGVKG